MSLQVGVRLGPYEVTGVLGAGGMGEVYRARDTRLKRDIALKILPASFAADPDRLARFQREAEVLASLNHPNIASIYGFEEASVSAVGAGFSRLVSALVLELIEGETLADRIRRGPIPVDEALPIAKQIAEALEAAHEHGVIHRDLKPANIKVTPDGVVKVLDFGLAKLTGPAEAGHYVPDVTASPTITSPAMMTGVGMLIGTAAYMAPEQAKGRPADKRSDVWAFGCVLYEMLTRQRAFDGEDVSDTLAAVLRAQPDWRTLPATTPPALGDLLRRCLERDQRNRLRDLGEARVAIQHVLDERPAAGPGGDAAGISAVNPRIPRVTTAVAAVAVLFAAALAWVHFGEQVDPADVVRFQVLAPEQTTFANAGVLSPDGRLLAFQAPGPDGRIVLWVRPFDSIEARVLPGTEGAAPGPFWSPDSRYLAFAVNGFPGRLKKVDASGGPPQTLCEYTGGFREGAWNSDGIILFGAGPTGLASVPDGGGTPTLVTRLDPARQEVQHAGPAFLPDGRRFLYHRASRAAENRGIYIGSLDAQPDAQSLVRLLAADSDPVYVPSADASGGFILFLREGTLLAQPFDGGATLTGEPGAVAQAVGNTGTYGWFSASARGSLAFRTGSDAAVMADLIWFDRQGRRTGQFGSSMEASTTGLNLSPDGRRVAISKTEGVASGAVGAVQDNHAWTAELSRGIFSRLNAGDGSQTGGIFSPEGRVAYTSTLNGAVGDIYWMPASGVGLPEPLLTKSPTVKHPNAFSPDGRFLIYDDHTAQRQDLWILPMNAPASGDRRPIPFLATPADETFGQFSPDGKWIAYSSDESGRREVYVQGFAPDQVPAAAVGKWQISTAGGDKPRWSRDGRELYYIGLDSRMMAVPVKIGPTFEPGVAVPLFQTRATGFYPYDVSSDGRFLVHTLSDIAAPASPPIAVILNWQSALNR